MPASATYDFVVIGAGFAVAAGSAVADASVMPTITFANTNAPSMMIGLRAGRMIAKDAA